MKKILSIVLFIIIGISVFAQDGYQMKTNEKEVEIDFLAGYYGQDGDNAAVTGGIGTERLDDFPLMVVVNVPLDSTKAVKLLLGSDTYSSASTDNIDDAVSSASSSDTRTYGNLAYEQKFPKLGQTYSIKVGFSTEYDYKSVSAGASFTQEWNQGNSELSIAGQVFSDEWELIYPMELRFFDVEVETPYRKSYNGSLVFSQVITSRMQVSIVGEMVYMNGLLSTPFHRVYFSDTPQIDIERLPSSRLKIPLSLRLNYFATDAIIIRSWYRFYSDDFGISAHSFELETPIKTGYQHVISPFIRLHTQTAANYFAQYGKHISTDEYYSSDYDLSGLQSLKAGLGYRFAPISASTKIPYVPINFYLKEVNARAAYYTRTTGLNAIMLSVAISVGLSK